MMDQEKLSDEELQRIDHEFGRAAVPTPVEGVIRRLVAEVRRLRARTQILAEKLVSPDGRCNACRQNVVVSGHAVDCVTRLT